MTLNAAQQAVVDSKAALRVVLAGPGSGKTRTEVEAVGVARGRVAIMTFTNSGADEFRRRILTQFITDGEYPFKLVYCGTLHGYCYRLINRFGNLLGYILGKVAILPDKERIPRLLACRDKLGVKITEALLTKGLPGCHPQFDLVWKEYEFLLKRNNLVDFELILRDGLALLRMPPVRHLTQLDYLFVDEYQDSALIDQTIYEAIPALNKMLVGDPDQSIFAFRGANPKRFLQLATYYEFIDRHYKAWEGGAAGYSQFPGSTTSGPDTPSVDTQIPTRAKTGLTASADENNTNGAEVHKLELNYRSDTKICAVANLLIRHNRERVEKQIIPVSKEEGVVKCFNFEDVSQELAFLSRKAASLRVADHTQSIAVLYRMNHDVKVCRDYLRSMGIPIQEQRYEQRPADWERALLLVGLLQSPENEILAERFLKLSHPADTVIRWLAEWRAGTGKSLSDHLKIALDPSILNAPQYLALNGVTESTVRLIQHRAELLAPDADLSDLIHALHEPEPENVSNDTTGVVVSTIHGAKGKEFDVVFLPAFEQGIIPSQISIRPDDSKDARVADSAEKFLNWKLVKEERRLAFVAVTRARHELYISHCAHRRGPWGPVGTGEVSMFVKEMGL